MFRGMTDTQWLRRLRLNVAWAIVLRVANSISVGYYQYGLWNFVCFKIVGVLVFLLRFRSISWSSYIYGTRKSGGCLANAQRMRNLFYSLRNEHYFIELCKFSSSKLFLPKKNSVTLVSKVLLNFPLLLYRYFRDMNFQ